MAAPIPRAWRWPVESTKVREFALAVRDVHLHDGDVAPPTFPTYGLYAFGPSLVAELGLDLKRVLHGEEEYQYVRPLRVGDRLRCTSRTVHDEVKPRRGGGTMRVVMVETSMQDEETGELAVTCRSTILELREGGGGEAG